MKHDSRWSHLLLRARALCALLICTLLGATGCGPPPSAPPEAEARPPEATQTAEARKPTEAELAAVTYERYREAPMLRNRVAVGALPPVHERLPKEPKVVETAEEIGTYGGELNVLAVDHSVNNDMQGLSGANLFRIPRSGVGVEPDLAAGYEISEDEQVLTILLREGLKWSDGEPFTAEDIRFMYQDLVLDPDVRAANALPQIQSVETVDDQTVRLICTPFGLGGLPARLAEWPGGQAQSFQPAHYLKKWHLRFNPDADTEARKAGCRDWADCLAKKMDGNGNPALPVMRPWVLEKTAMSAKSFVRNPYFWRVDAQGNQLPYIDRVVVRIMSVSTIDYTAYLMEEISAKTDLVYSHTAFSRLGYYEQNRGEGGYRILLYPDPVSSLYTLSVFQNHREPEVRAVLNSLGFREALSVALNREEINEILYSGAGVPGQAAPLPSCSFYREEWSGRHAEYDPGAADRLLDSLRMTNRDAEGFRRRPDGKPFVLVLMYSESHTPALLELVKEYWEAVGLKTVVRQQEGSILQERIQRGDVMVYLRPGRSFPPSSERSIRGSLRLWASGIAPTWEEWSAAKWRAVQKARGADLPEEWWKVVTIDDADLPEEQPPVEWIENWGNQERWLEAGFGSAEYRELAREIFDYWTGSLYHIGTVGRIPRVMLAAEDLGNVPPPGWVNGAALDNELMGQWYGQLFWKDSG